MLKSNPFPNDFSLVGSAAAPHVQSSLGTLKVTQQLQWTLMGHWGAVLHITGLLPLQSKRFQQSAAAAIWGGRKENLPSLAGGGVFSPPSTWPLVDRLHVSARKRKIKLLQIVPACHRYNPVPKSLINWVFASTVNLADLSQEPLLPPQHFTTLNQWVKGSTEQRFGDTAEKLGTAPICH